jgi:molecular chaperone GrpE
MRRKIEIVSEEPLVTQSVPVEEESEITAEVVAESDAADNPAAESAIDPPGETQALSDGAMAYITALQAEIEELRAQKEEAERRLVYMQAEFQNYRRRKEDENAGLVKFGNSELIKSLLPILDNFERALQAAEQTRNFDALIGGVSGTLKQLHAFLEKSGVTMIEAVGKEFDPNFHEAISRVEESGLPANTVAEEVQRGYMLHDRVLRPSLVKVAD